MRTLKMRTLKTTLAAFGALLLVASGANATISFSVSAAAPDADTAQEIDITLTVTGGSMAGTDNTNTLLSFQVDWLLNNAAIPLSAVQTPASSGTGPNLACNSANNQFMCAFGGATVVGSGASNSVGNDWLWDPTNPTIDGAYSLGRFTFTELASGNVSIGNCSILDSDLNSVPCSSNAVGLVPVPEPTTAALLGLGLFGLVIGGGRRR